MTIIDHYLLIPSPQISESVSSSHSTRRVLSALFSVSNTSGAVLCRFTASTKASIFWISWVRSFFLGTAGSCRRCHSNCKSSFFLYQKHFGICQPVAWTPVCDATRRAQIQSQICDAIRHQ